MRKVALIIGGSSGIGFDLAQILIKNQYVVYNLSRSECLLKEVNDISYDILTNNNLLSNIKERKLDLVVFTENFSLFSPIEIVDIKDVKSLFDVNYFSIIKILKEVIPILKLNDGGNIILLSSFASYLNIPYDTYYGASKSCINALALELNLELNRFGIKALAVCLGLIKSNVVLNRKVYNDFNDLTDYQDYDNVVNSLISLESKGITINSSAKKLFKIIKKIPKINSKRYLINLGFKTKLMYILNKYLPNSIIYKIMMKKYYLNK